MYYLIFFWSNKGIFFFPNVVVTTWNDYCYSYPQGLGKGWFSVKDLHSDVTCVFSLLFLFTPSFLRSLFYLWKSYPVLILFHWVVTGWSKGKDLGDDWPRIKSSIIIPHLCWLWSLYRSYKSSARVYRFMCINGNFFFLTSKKSITRISHRW